MAENTKIAWCDHTHNFWIGCTAVSPACDGCYAESLVRRYGGDFATRRRTSEANWKLPFKWNRMAAADGKRHRVFSLSLGDFFDNKASDQWRHDAWEVIRACQNLDFLLLTKRPQNIRKMLPANWGDGWANVWLGTTVENQEEADRRIPHLLEVRARTKFLSCEPLLGKITLDVMRWPKGAFWPRCDCKGHALHLDVLNGTAFCSGCCEGPEALDGCRIDWVICGGESGPGWRAMNPDWARYLRDQCADADVPFFMKQMSGNSRVKLEAIPEDLMIRQFPKVERVYA